MRYQFLSIMNCLITKIRRKNDKNFLIEKRLPNEGKDG